MYIRELFHELQNVGPVFAGDENAAENLHLLLNSFDQFNQKYGGMTCFLPRTSALLESDPVSQIYDGWYEFFSLCFFSSDF